LEASLASVSPNLWSGELPNYETRMVIIACKSGAIRNTAIEFRGGKPVQAETWNQAHSDLPLLFTISRNLPPWMFGDLSIVVRSPEGTEQPSPPFQRWECPTKTVEPRKGDTRPSPGLGRPCGAWHQGFVRFPPLKRWAMLFRPFGTRKW
jgi:hypothetical protein